MLSALRRHRLRLALCLALAAALLPASIAFAQSADTAGLEVYVRDASGAIVPDAKVHIEQQEQHIVRDAVTDKNGHYRFTEIPVGDYVLTVEKEGFGKLVESGISLAISQVSTLNLQMVVASENTQINVTTEVPIIDTDRSTVGQTISNIEIENLPSNGRDFLDFALTVPGITSNASSGQGSGLSANGGRQRSNNIMIDGVENNGLLNGTVRQTISLDAISQFQVLTNQFLPEYGQASGALVNLITKSGSERFHGGAFFFARRQALNAQPVCFIPASSGGCPNPIYVRNDGGATLGGPMGDGKTFFFTSFEYTGVNADLFNNIPAAFVPIANQVLSVKNNPYNSVIGTTVNSIAGGVIYQSSAQTLASLRLDHTFNERNTVTFRLLYGHYINANPTLDRDDGTYSDFSNYGADHNIAYNYMGEWTHIFAPSLLNEFHFQYSPQKVIQVGNATGPEIQLTSTAEFGSNPATPTVLNESHYEWIDALSWTKRNHFLKFGADISYIRTYTSYPLDFQGAFFFGSSYGTLAQATDPTPGGSSGCPLKSAITASNLACGNPYEFIQAFGDPFIHLPDKLLGFYAEDQWKAMPRLSLNYGIRYDLDLQPQGYNQNLSDPIQAPLPKGIPRDYNNFAARFGFAYSLDRNGKTVVRGGYGMFYDRIFLILARDVLLTRETLTAEDTNTSYSNIAALYAQGPFPQSTQYPPSLAAISLAPSITAIPNKLPIPIAHQANLYVDRAISKDWSFEAGYVFVSGQHLLRANNTNLFPPTINTTSSTFQTQGRPYYTTTTRPNNNFRNILEYGSWGHSTYSGMRATIYHRVSQSLTLRANYVWARAVDDGSDFTSGGEPSNPFVPQQEKSLSTQDQRNRFVGSAVYQVPYKIHRHNNSILRWVAGNWVLSSITIVGSGTPENITTGTDSNGDGNTNDRPYIHGVNGLNGGQIVSRNAFRGPRTQNVSFRMQKRISLPRSIGNRLEFSVEAYNLFNHSNFTDANTVWGTTSTPNGTGTSGIQQPLVWGRNGEPTTGVFGAFDAAALAGSTNSARSIQLGIRYSF